MYNKLSQKWEITKVIKNVGLEIGSLIIFILFSGHYLQLEETKFAVALGDISKVVFMYILLVSVFGFYKLSSQRSDNLF